MTSETPQVNDSSAPRWSLSPRLPLSGHDLASLRDLGLDKLHAAWDTAPLYVPSRQAVGRSLTVRSGLDGSAGLGSIESREVLPARSIELGDEGSLEVPPLRAFSLQPGRLVSDARGFAGFITDAGSIIAEVSEDYRGSKGELRSLTKLQRYPRRVQQVGPLASLLTGGGGSPTYFHWLYDVLPRVALLDRAGFVREGDRYLVPRLSKRFQSETLEIMGIDPAQCVQLTGPALLEAERLSVSAGHRSFRRVEPWIPKFLRDRLMSDTPQTGLLLYANRRDTKIRNILNEDRLETALAGRGFRSISLASHSFEEKVRLFAAADMVVAPHGAGLSHVPFCSAGAKVLDVRDPAFFWPVFGDAARGVAVQYETVDALQMVGWPRLPRRVRHMEVDVDRVMDRVDASLG